jgi:hypothetical protein
MAFVWQWRALARFEGLRTVLGAAAVLLALAGHAQAQADPPAIAPAWQAAITAQLEAFRSGNADAAFGFASRDFHLSFPTARAFYETLVGSDYQPLLQSVSHSFGDYAEQQDMRVLQKVRVVAPNQTIYEAVYRMRLEPQGWKVEGVSMLTEAGMAI